MKMTVLLLAIFSLGLTAQENLLEHKIKIPVNHLNGRTTEGFAGTSDAARYIENFERTWWKVMRAFVSGTPDWKSHEDFALCSGSPAAADACMYGYESASKKLRELVKKYGETKVKSYIEERLESKI